MRRYRENISDMLHELTLMRNRGEIKVPENMTKTEFEEIMKKIEGEKSGTILDLINNMIN